MVDRSMVPALLPGDWILVDPDVSALRPGDVVVADDPDHPGGAIVKRLASWSTGTAELTSDGSPRRYVVPRASVTGRAWLRYWPPDRVGRIR